MAPTSPFLAFVSSKPWILNPAVLGGSPRVCAIDLPTLPANLLLLPSCWGGLLALEGFASGTIVVMWLNGTSICRLRLDRSSIVLPEFPYWHSFEDGKFAAPEKHHHGFRMQFGDLHSGASLVCGPTHACCLQCAAWSHDAELLACGLDTSQARGDKSVEVISRRTKLVEWSYSLEHPQGSRAWYVAFSCRQHLAMMSTWALHAWNAAIWQRDFCRYQPRLGPLCWPPDAKLLIVYDVMRGRAIPHNSLDWETTCPCIHLHGAPNILWGMTGNIIRCAKSDVFHKPATRRNVSFLNLSA